MAACATTVNPALATNAGIGARQALRDEEQDDRSPERWRTANMEYGHFYRVPRDGSRSPGRSASPRRPDECHHEERPLTPPSLKLDALHEECERKWDLLAKQLEECRTEMEKLRLQKQIPAGDTRSKSPRRPHYKCGQQFVRGRSSPDKNSRGGRQFSISRSGGPAGNRDEDIEWVDGNRTKREGSPVLNIYMRRSPSPTLEDDDDEKCDRCTVLEKAEEAAEPRQPKKRWRTAPTPSSSVLHASSKYNYYKYYGYAGHGAKTSWGHNLPLGIAPPYSVKAPPKVVDPCTCLT